LSNINWVCPPCISSIREKCKLVDDQIQSLSTALHKLEADHHSLVQKVDGVVTATPSAATIVQSNGSTFHAVNTADTVTPDQLMDQMRRKRNIIISGLPESQQMSDDESLQSLCENNLSYRPWFEESQCQRIGKSSPRLLRATLASEHAAVELLVAAKTRLSRSDDSSLRNIYFNPDLNPTEAKKAYLLRKERRERRQGTTGNVTGNSMLILSAQPFATTSGGSTGSD